MYSVDHLGKGFAKDGHLDEDIDSVLRDLSERPGYFAPVSEVLALRDILADRYLG